MPTNLLSTPPPLPALFELHYPAPSTARRVIVLLPELSIETTGLAGVLLADKYNVIQSGQLKLGKVKDS